MSKKNETKIASVETVNAINAVSAVETNETNETKKECATMETPKNASGIVILSAEKVAGKKIGETRIYRMTSKEAANVEANRLKESGQKYKVLLGTLRDDEAAKDAIVITTAEKVAGKKIGETHIFANKVEAEGFATTMKEAGKKMKVYRGIFA